MSQEQKTREFFDNISKDYKSKYKNRSPFHVYFFNERLEKATQGIDFNGKKVLDIGSGTGNLFDYIHERFPQVDFYATDISEGMLAQSNVPADHKFAGNSYSIKYPVEKFDYIFMLGVTTYMNNEELSKTMQFISSHLNSGGQAIITFTNRTSHDQTMRKLLKQPLRTLFRKRGSVLTQSFDIFTYSADELKTKMANWFKIDRLDYLNHTIFPFNFLLPGYSLKRAKKISASPKADGYMEKNSTDFILRMSAK